MSKPTVRRSPPGLSSREGQTRSLALLMTPSRLESAQLESQQGEPAHLEEQPPVLEAADVGHAVRTGGIANRYLRDLQVCLGGTEDGVEIPERVEIPEVGAIARDQVVVHAAERLGSAQGVADRLVQEPGEDETEEAVAQLVQEAHRL